MRLCNYDCLPVSPTPAEAAYYCCVTLRVCNLYYKKIVGARASFVFCVLGMLSAQTE